MRTDTKKKKNTKRKKGSKADIKIPSVVVIAVIVTAIIVSAVTISFNRREPQQFYDFGKDVAQGIDVSEHNGEIDWDKINETQDFAFIRVGYRGYGDGELHEDKRARENLKNAQKSKIAYGVYFYTQAVNEKEAQKEADFVYNIIKKYDVALPVMIDFEYPSDKDGNAVGRLVEAELDASANTDIINAFTSRLQERGYICGVYASSSVFAHRINMKKLNDNTVIWAADYNKDVTYNIDYTIWQYSETGQCDGIGSKYVDLNYWYN